MIHVLVCSSRRRRPHVDIVIRRNTLGDARSQLASLGTIVKGIWSYNAAERRAQRDSRTERRTEMSPLDCGLIRAALSSNYGFIVIGPDVRRLFEYPV